MSPNKSSHYEMSPRERSARYGWGILFATLAFYWGVDAIMTGEFDLPLGRYGFSHYEMATRGFAAICGGIFCIAAAIGCHLHFFWGYSNSPTVAVVIEKLTHLCAWIAAIFFTLAMSKGAYDILSA